MARKSTVDWSSLPLGKVPDREIAAQLSMSVSGVQAARRRLGIPARSKLGKVKKSASASAKTASAKSASAKRAARNRTNKWRALPRAKQPRGLVLCALEALGPATISEVEELLNKVSGETWDQQRIYQALKSAIHKGMVAKSKEWGVRGERGRILWTYEITDAGTRWLQDDPS